ncbi:MAG: isoaspartyl peptidase/L-asparaginase [Acidobacteria bacterium]|nr:isoaspartyl peptidase/L-asparaginase [Acidobacteriota bacterium]
MSKMALAIHGGAGTILRSAMTPELEAEYRRGLEAALKAGWDVLQNRGSALDSVEAAVVSLEDFPLFNAGRGSVFTHEGTNEMDACIMDGRTPDAGAVAFVRSIKNPVRLARLVMETTDHILLAGEGAKQFADENGLATEPDEYFFTEHRWLQYQDALASGRIQLDHAAPKPMGTVGAAACDANGHLAAATSTGGMTNKKFGRVGDTPIIGSGTYADDLCAVSCTGHGEYFMLGVTAFDVSARMKYKGLGLADAAAQSIEHLTALKGEGGLIAVDREGNVAMPFNCEGMYRGWITSEDDAHIDIYAPD